MKTVVEWFQSVKNDELRLMLFDSICEYNAAVADSLSQAVSEAVGFKGSFYWNILADEIREDSNFLSASEYVLRFTERYRGILHKYLGCLTPRKYVSLRHLLEYAESVGELPQGEDTSYWHHIFSYGYPPPPSCPLCKSAFSSYIEDGSMLRYCCSNCRLGIDVPTGYDYNRFINDICSLPSGRYLWCEDT